MGRQPQPEIKQRLLATCTDHALAHGLPDRLEPLVTATGMSSRMLLYHFGTRDDLLREVLHETRARQVRAWSDLLQSRPNQPYLDTLHHAWKIMSGPQGRAYLRVFSPLHDAAVHVTSGLALVPLTAAPVYSATKAAVRSFTVSLRRQLKDSSVQVVELLPPVVKTGLHRHQQRQPPRAMELDAFVTSALRGLDSGRDEVYVGLAKALRVGSRVAPGRFLAIVNKA